MTRNIQWRRTGACSDELQLLRNSTITNHRRRGNTSNRSQNRCVSWAPDTYTSNESAAANGPLSSAVAYAADFREYRKRVARSWCGQTLSSPVGGTGSSLGVNSGGVAGPYGSLEATVADTGALLPSSTTSSPLHSSATQPLLQAADGNIGADTSVTTPQIAATHAAAARLTAGASPLPTKRRVGRSKIDLIMPSLRSLVSRRAASGSTSSLSGVGNSVSGTVGWVDGAKTPIIVVDSGSGNNIDGGGSGGGSGSSPHAPPSPLPLEFISSGGGLGLRKCETAVTLSTASSRTTLLAEPLQAINRLRVTPGDGARSLCSRCSSLLSLQASGSRYSLNTATAAFVPVANNNTTTSTSTTITTVPCKLCLADVRTTDTCALRQCACVFCRDCMQAYVSFEITEGAYDISCPDAQCPAQGVLTLPEIERLVDTELIKKHKKYRLNREVDIDKSRTWCPRAGCETVCELCPSEKCAPQSVHCPTCASDFCSNCKRPWHGSMTCEEQAKLSGADSPPGIPFDSDLIKCCPMCNVPIEKDEGCAQMMCKRCKHVFCWYCLTSLDDDFLLRHYDKGPCKNKLGHSRASVIWHRTQVIGIFAGFGILLLVASPLLLLAAPCIVCCKCRMCNSTTKLDNEEEIPEESASGTSQTNNYIRW